MIRSWIVEFFVGFKHYMNRTIWGKKENCGRVGSKAQNVLAYMELGRKNVWVYILDIFTR